MKFGMNSLTWRSPFSDEALPLFRKAADLGCDVFEITVEDINTINTKAIKKEADACNLTIPFCGAFGPKLDMSHEDPEIRKAARSYLFRLIDFSCETGSRMVSGPMYSAVGKARLVPESVREQQRVWAADGIRDAAEYAEKCGVKLAIEPLNRFESDLINTVDQGLDLLRRIGDFENVGFLLDTFHMGIEEADIPLAIRKAGRKLFEFHACANNRGPAGKDNFKWDEFKLALHEIGYDGALIVESFTPDCVEIAKAASIWRPLAPSPEQLVAEGIAFLRKTFS